MLAKRTAMPMPAPRPLHYIKPFEAVASGSPESIISAACSCISSLIPCSTTTVTTCTTITSSAPKVTSTTYNLTTAFTTVHSTINTTATTTVSANPTAPTILPDPACQDASCGSFRDCGGVLSGTCSCYSSAEGPGYCALDTACDGIKTCDTTADCGLDAICAVNTCCSDAGVCLGLQCGNPSLRLSQMAQRLGGRTSRNDGSGRIGSGEKR